MSYTPSSVARELEFNSDIAKGASGMKARRVQEWLKYHGVSTAIDSSFGSATEECVRAFQKQKGLGQTGVVNRSTWDDLVKPLFTAVSATVSTNATLDDAVLKIAKAHLKIHPVELGGDNRGPWVRAYCGEDGSAMRWCAGFVTFILKQACFLTGSAMPVQGSLSCDSLAYQAKDKGRFRPGKNIANGSCQWSSLGSCQVFLVRKSATDWIHTGLAFAGSGDIFSTIEGNTNDEGSANGYEVCQRTRSLDAKDFIHLA